MKHLKLFENFKSNKENVLEMSSNLLPIVEVGMYETVLDSDNLFDRQLEEEYFTEELREKYYDVFDFQKYKDFILKMCKLFFEEKEILKTLKSYNLGIKDIELVKIYSPKFYNYETDKLYFDLHVEPYFKRKLLNKFTEISNQQGGAERLNSFLKGEYSSKPGFFSFMPDNIEDLEEEIVSGDLERASAAILTFLLSEDELLYNTEMFEEFIRESSEYESTSILDFVDDSTKEGKEFIEEYKKTI